MSVSYGVTFETKCYENDWEYILKTNYLNKMIENCNFNFDCRNIIINNVKQRDVVEYYAQKKVNEKTVTAFYFVDDYIEDALEFFGIEKESFNGGYCYSSAELVGLYVAKTKYLLHFSGDSFLPKRDRNNWIAEACGILENDQEIVAANPRWYEFDREWKEAKENRIGNFYLGYGFSDQCYLVKADVFRAKIYDFKHPNSERYPKYGGELFEKRVDSYMWVNEKQRITSINESYIHTNFPNRPSLKIVVKILIGINLYFWLNDFIHATKAIEILRIGRKCIRRIGKKVGMAHK